MTRNKATQIMNALSKAGIISELATCTDGQGRGRHLVVIARHDYAGPYADEEARAKRRTAEAIAAKHRQTCESRGSGQATWIR